MNPPGGKVPTADRHPDMKKWQKRSLTERRADGDKRTKNSHAYFVNGGTERRTGNERRHSEERRDRWIRVGKWRSEAVFDE